MLYQTDERRLGAPDQELLFRRDIRLVHDVNNTDPVASAWIIPARQADGEAS